MAFQRIATTAAATGLLVLGGPAVTTGTAAPGATTTCTTSITVAKDGMTTQVPAASLVVGRAIDCRMEPSERTGIDALRALHTSLNACNDANLGPFDGIFGIRYREALGTVRANAGLSPVGVYDPDTRDAMYWRFTGDAGTACLRL